MKKLLLLFTVLLSLFALPALCEEARDITAECTYKSETANAPLGRLFDDSYQSALTCATASTGYLQIDLPEGENIGGLYIKWGKKNLPFFVQVKNAEDKWETVIEYKKGESFYHQYIPLDTDARSVRLRAAKGQGAALSITELRVFTTGDVPASVQQWQTKTGKADMMLVVAHPDDELFWFGGFLPTYAGERQKKVQVVYMTTGSLRRVSELLDGLWICGVRDYPELLFLEDTYSMDMLVVMRSWSEQRTVNKLVKLIRAYQPDVVLTQAESGEYGHGGHKAVNVLVTQAVKSAADSTCKIKEYPITWQVKKYYVHLHAENQIRMDWNVPLDAFAGETGMQVAARALLCHVSQAKTPHEMLDSGAYDCSLFGLYSSTVGEDVLKNDFLENIDD